MLETAVENFLWALLRLGILRNDAKHAIEWAGSYYEKGLELPMDLEAFLDDYCASEDQATLNLLALTALKKFWLEVDHRTCLTAYLFVEGEIDLVQACSFLSFSDVNVDDLDSSVRRVADVLWLLKQDSDARVMEVGDDGLLSEALRDLAKANAVAAD
jgi:hypothetical protein